MTRLSFAIVVLLFFNPVTEVWRRVIAQPPPVSVIGLAVRLNSPYIGMLYLVALALVSWILLTLLLIGLESYLIPGFSRRPAFRDGVILASGPSLIYYPEVLAKYLFWILLGKIVIGELIGLLLKIPALAGLLGARILGIVGNVLGALQGGSSGQALELMMLALCFVLLILKHYFYLEKDMVYFDEIKKAERQRFRDGRGLERGA